MKNTYVKPEVTEISFAMTETIATGDPWAVFSVAENYFGEEEAE